MIDPYEVYERPKNAPEKAQALVKLLFAKCWMWFDSDGVPVLDEVSFLDGILLRISSFIGFLICSNGFPIEVLEVYDRNFDHDISMSELYG